MGDIPSNHLMVEVRDPVAEIRVPESTDLVDWVPVLNVGDVFDDYCDFDFRDESKVEGTTGRAWIESRIYETYEGYTTSD